MSAVPNTASHVGKETTINALGKTWRVAKAGRWAWTEFFKWAATVLPDPVKVARDAVQDLVIQAGKIIRKEIHADLAEGDRIALLQGNERMQQQLTSEALDKKASYLSMGSKEVGSLLNSIDGGSQMLCIVLKRNHPEMDIDLAYEIVQEIGLKHVQDKIDEAAGAAPPKNESAPAGSS